MLTVNTPYSTDLAYYLKKQTVKVKDLKKGDIIVDDHNVYHAVITKNEDGTFDVLDEDENGSIGDKPDDEYTIIARSAYDDI